MSEAFDRVVGLLERVKVVRPGDVLGSCPVGSHGQGRGDKNPSLHVTEADGKVLLDCKGNCHVQDVLLALGLDYPDLFDRIEGDRGHLVARYVYQKPDGTPYHVNERWQTPTGKRFVQRLPDAEKPGLQGVKPALYHLPQVIAHVAKGGTVYYVEGEKCVHAAESLGLVATCASNGVNGWRDYYTAWLRGAGQVIVVADNDEPGQQYAAHVVAMLRGAGIKARAVRVAVETPKADLYDHVAAGFKEADLIPVNLNRLRPAGATMNTILTSTYPPVRWAVHGLISSGLTLLGGAPKIGKSWITLELALGVACGGRALSALTCEQGAVLYLTLDNDTERRVQERAAFIMAGQTPEEAIPIEVHTDWPTGVAALAACQEWANETDDPRMVVIDTLVRAEPSFGGDRGQDAYAASVEVLSRWSRFGIDRGIAVVAVHHDRKPGKDEAKGDWMDRFLGSRGITATAQTLLMVDAKRGESEGTLRVSGRDIQTDDLEMRRVGRTWVVMDSPEVEQHTTLHVVK